MAMTLAATTAPPRDCHEPQESRRPRESHNDHKRRISHSPRDPCDIDEAEAEALQHALQASCHDAQWNQPKDTSGAGPSHNPSHSASHQASSSQLRAPTAPAPDPASPAPDPTSNHHDYEVVVIQRFGTHFPDPVMVKWPGFACIPLPDAYTMPHKGLAVVHGPSMPPKPEDAMSYLEMWAGFTVRCMVSTKLASPSSHCESSVMKPKKTQCHRNDDDMSNIQRTSDVEPKSSNKKTMGLEEAQEEQSDADVDTSEMSDAFRPSTLKYHSTL
jgi:hypothetical protein